MAYIGDKIHRGVRWRGVATFLGPSFAGLGGLSGCLTDFPPPLEDGGTVTSSEPEPTQEPDAAVSETSGSSGSNPRPEGGVDQPDASETTDDSGMSTQDTTDVSSVAPTGSEDAQVPIECPSGTTECNGTCTPGNSCCATSCEASNATTECRDQECVIVECTSEFVDCDGNFDNGCEQDMAADEAPVASVDEPFLVPPFDFDTDIRDIDYRAWQGIPRFQLASGCGTCEPTTAPPDVPPITPSGNRGKVPGQSDLKANYALAWDETGLWVNLVVVDNEVLGDADVSTADGDPRQYDNLMVVWDPTAGSSNPGTGDDHIAFIGVDERLVDWRDENTDGISVAVKGVGQCRSIHAYFPRPYLFGSDGSAPPTFEPGDRHGLVVAYNDFDFEPETTIAEREHVVFGVDMTFGSGADYFQGERTLPQVELTGP